MQKSAKNRKKMQKNGKKYAKIDIFVVFLKIRYTMSEEKIKKGIINNMSNPIDTKVISKLAEILDKNQLTGLKYEDDSCKISLSRDCHGYGAVCTPVVAAPAVQPVSAPETVAEVTPKVEDYTNSPNAVKSPMVGVVYLSSNPTSPNYVKEGDNVSAGDTVCLIEAMKTFNPVKAHKSGKVTKVLVETGDPIEYGEPLIIIE